MLKTHLVSHFKIQLQANLLITRENISTNIQDWLSRWGKDVPVWRASLLDTLFWWRAHLMHSQGLRRPERRRTKGVPLRRIVNSIGAWLAGGHLRFWAREAQHIRWSSRGWAAIRWLGGSVKTCSRRAICVRSSARWAAKDNSPKRPLDFCQSFCATSILAGLGDERADWVEAEGGNGGGCQNEVDISMSRRQDDNAAHLSNKEEE